MPALLLERVKGEPRIKNGVKIDIDQVVEVPEIFWLATGYQVLSGKVIALRKVFSEPFMSSTNGSLTGYLREPHGVLENVGDTS